MHSLLPVVLLGAKVRSNKQGRKKVAHAAESHLEFFADSCTWFAYKRLEA